MCRGKENRCLIALKYLQIDERLEDGSITSIYLGLGKVVCVTSSEDVESKLHIFEIEFHSVCAFI